MDRSPARRRPCTGRGCQRILGAVLPEAVIKELEPRVLIADVLPLRGVGIKGLLRDWAQLHGVELDLMDPSAAEEGEPPSHTYRMIILSLGHLSVVDRLSLGWLARLQYLYPDAPMVIWSDRNGPQEALQALRHGAQGFVPTMTTPQLALQALTFIMSGGTFFPPEALTDLRPSDAEERGTTFIGRSEPEDGPNGHGRTMISHRVPPPAGSKVRRGRELLRCTVRTRRRPSGIGEGKGEGDPTTRPAAVGAVLRLRLRGRCRLG